MWTHFWDMSSGGREKEKWGHIYIEASEDEARIIFYNRFGHNPNRVSCTCCGQDYSISSDESLKRLTGYQRNCAVLATPKDKRGLYIQPKDKWFKEHYYLDPPEIEEAQRRGWAVEERFHRTNPWISLDDFLKEKNVLFIPASEIKDSERCGEIPKQGYIWVE